jgi:hypothetical protein
VRLTVPHLRKGATRRDQPPLPDTQPPADATPEGDAPANPDTQADTQAASPAEKQRRKATHPKVARKDRRDARRDKRDAASDALRKRATAMVSQATGRYAQRVGFATTGQRIAAYASLAGVLVCVGYMSWDGEYNWATHELLWIAVSALMVPVALDLAAVACTLLAATQIDKGESGFIFRLLGAVFMGLGAWINWRYALRSGNVTEEVFFPAMSGLAYSLIHAVLSAARREARRRQHGHKSKERPEPLPWLGILVWLPWIGQPREALEVWREEIRMRLAKVLARTQLPAAATGADTQAEDEADAADPGGADEEDADQPLPEIDLTHLPTQADAIRWVLANISDAPLDALRYMRTHGFPTIKPQRIHDQIRRDARVRTDPQAATAGDAPATTPDAAAAGGA